MSKPLDNAFIEQLLKTKTPQAATPRRKKVSSFDTVESRTYTNWFTLTTKLAVCSNPDCSDTRELKTADGNAMCAVISDAEMCRICFLDGYGVVV
jgi:hypothetical protein